MGTYPECKFYIKGGKCSHQYAPNPYHSYCIGRKACHLSWGDGIEWQAKQSEKKEVL